MNNQFEFRELLLKIQDLLSDNDRERLHFLLGDDVPRNLRDDPSLGGTLRVLQSLFDKAIINEQDCDYLIEALKKIRCFDAAQRLQEYQQKHNGRLDTQSLSLTDILWKEAPQEDKVTMNKIIYSCLDTNDANRISFKPVTSHLTDQGSGIPEHREENQQKSTTWIRILCRSSFTLREYLLLTGLLLLFCLCVVLFVLKLRIKNEKWIGMMDSVSAVESVSMTTRWSPNGITIMGGHGPGDALNQLRNPSSIFIDHDDDVLYVVDFRNNRVLRRNLNSTDVQLVTNSNGTDQLQNPSGVTLEKGSNSLIICDNGNRRLVRISLKTGRFDNMYITDINCVAIFLDRFGFLYVTDNDRDEVRRYRVGESDGKVIAGGHGEGENLDQLNSPMGLALDDESSLYVTDYNNHRVMKWKLGAEEGLVVGGGLGRGSDLSRLQSPYGILVDRSHAIYVADSENHRIMRWRERMFQGEVIVGGNGLGDLANQLNSPSCLAFDRHGNLYVADENNHRIQQFLVEKY